MKASEIISELKSVSVAISGRVYPKLVMDGAVFELDLSSDKFELNKKSQIIEYLDEDMAELYEYLISKLEKVNGGTQYLFELNLKGYSTIYAVIHFSSEYDYDSDNNYLAARIELCLGYDFIPQFTKLN